MIFINNKLCIIREHFAPKKVTFMTINIVPISDLRRQTQQVFNTLRESGEVVYITQHGRPTAVLVDFEQYEALLAQLEELADMASLETAVNEPERDYESFLREMNAAPDRPNS
jgi:prevent-host-death family protein